jgi:salicylate hydroxylase
MIRNAIVIGGGIGGLAVATALARHGIAVTLLEQAPEITEVGAGLQISPNGLAVLRALGLDDGLLRSGAVPARAVVLADYRKPGDVARLDLTRLTGQRYLFLHRADLIAALACAARQANVSLELGARVTRVVPGDLPVAVMQDGSEQRAELIVCADGLHSVGRAALQPELAPVFTGQVAWRGLVPVRDPAPEARVTMAPGRHIVSYPIRDGALMNFVAVQERKEWAEEGWHHSDDPRNLRAAFDDLRGPARDVLDRVTEVRLWGLFRHPVADVWQAGGVALLGDAAHPTLPFLAQGANLALEDAWVLAATIARGDGLAAYEHRRKPRAIRVVGAASGNARKYHLRHGPVRYLAHAALRLGSAMAPGLMIRQFDWLYGHDVTKNRAG